MASPALCIGRKQIASIHTATSASDPKWTSGLDVPRAKFVLARWSVVNLELPLDYFHQHAERDRGLRIDHVLLNHVLAKRLKGAGVDRWVRLQEKASDHAPTWIQVGA